MSDIDPRTMTTVYVIQYWATDGILKAQTSGKPAPGEGISVRNKRGLYWSVRGYDWKLTEAEARAEIAARRDARIASLQKQIEALRAVDPQTIKVVEE